MRISDWSSDVCSSDLVGGRAQGRHDAHPGSCNAAPAYGSTPLPDGRGHARRFGRGRKPGRGHVRSEEHTSELQSLMRISYAVFCLKKKRKEQLDIEKPTTKAINKRSNERIANSTQELT